MVTVVEPKSGQPVTGLKAQDFALFDDKKPLRVEDAEFSQATIDVMLLLDTSLMGQMVQPVAETLIGQLQPKEQMAVVAYHSSADLIQDFTSSRQMLSRAVSKVKYGNTPHVLDALYASIDGGFQGSSFRRIILLVTAGAEGQQPRQRARSDQAGAAQRSIDFPGVYEGLREVALRPAGAPDRWRLFQPARHAEIGREECGREDIRSAARALHGDGERQLIVGRESPSRGQAPGETIRVGAARWNR